MQTDYLILGAGTCGLAFADTLVEQHPSATLTIVDRRGQPGGHWRDAYPFVRLHQPSAFYGVNSLALGSGSKDEAGLNAGLAELASGAELNAYFERVLQRLQASGRVRWLPMHEHRGAGVVQSLLTGHTETLEVGQRIVDSGYQGPAIPSTHRPRFEVEEGVSIVPPNALPALWQHAVQGKPLPTRFVVVGAGKTAMDSISWLLQAGAAAESIQWLMPRDAWLVNRITTQNGPEFFDAAIGGQAHMMQAFAQAESVTDLYLRLEAAGVLLRIDRSRLPTMFHLATTTPAEVALLATVTDVVRLGRVRRIGLQRIELEQGTVPVADAAHTLFIDCSASAVEPRERVPVFQPGRIVVQMLRLPQPAFSAALTAWLEVHGESDKQRNALAAPVPFPHTLAGYPQGMLVGLWNQAQWTQHPALKAWMRSSRLDGYGALMASARRDDPAQQALIARFKQHLMPAMANLQKLGMEA
jgi:hypothetical protein